MNTRSESIQRDQKWETSKLKQRDEQALILSEQVIISSKSVIVLPNLYK